MNREIIFRKYDAATGNFFFGKDCGFTEDSVDEYIGHRDKNNCQIFENDIVLLFGKYQATVEYDNSHGFVYRFKNPIYSIELNDIFVEVVGNIYKNVY